MTEVTTNIPARLKNVAVDGHVAGVEDIVDDVSGKTQQTINSDVQADLESLRDLYQALTQKEPAIGPLPQTGEKAIIYRVPGESSYADWMWNGTQFVQMAEYDNAIDDEPTTGSDNLVKSGGVYDISLIKKFKIIAGTQSWIEIQDYVKGKKVLMKASVNDYFPIYDGSTSLNVELYNIWTYYDFTNIQSFWLQLYPSEVAEDVIVEYIDNEYIVDEFTKKVNVKDYATDAHINGRIYFSTDKKSLLYQSVAGIPKVLFPNKSSDIPTAINISSETIAKNNGDLYKWNSNLLIYEKYLSESDISVLIPFKKAYPISLSNETITLNVDIPIGAYKITAEFSDAAFFGINVLDADGNTLAGNNYGADANSRKTIPIESVYSAEHKLYKEVYFSKPAKQIEFTSPNAPTTSVIFEQIENNTEYDIVVASDGSGMLSSLWDAIKWVGDTANNHKTIYVKPGNYEMPAQQYGFAGYRESRNISIIGADKNACVLYNNNGRYEIPIEDNAPLQLSGNVTIKNLTIISTGENIVSGEPKAYCIHIDYDAAIGSNVLISNCVLKNNHAPCVGIGTRNGLTVTIENCDLSSEFSQSYDLWHGVVVAHDAPEAGSSLQSVRLLNNILQSNRKGFSFTGNNSPLYITFIRNAIFYNEQLMTLDGEAGAYIDNKTCLNNVDIQSQ